MSALRCGMCRAVVPRAMRPRGRPNVKTHTRTRSRRERGWRGRRSPLEVATQCAKEGSLTAGAKSGDFAVVVGKFNALVTKALLDGALKAFGDFNVAEAFFDVVWVPGSFEIPVVAKRLAASGKYSAVICLSAIIRGGTSHYDAVVNAATNGILRAGLDTGVPVVFGVLTCDTLEQAFDRAGGKMGNKGYEAVVTALEMAALMKE